MSCNRQSSLMLAFWRNYLPKDYEEYLWRQAEADGPEAVGRFLARKLGPSVRRALRRSTQPKIR